MNDFFSFRRWARLLKKQWLERRKNYMVGIAGYFGLLLIGYFLAANSDKTMDDYRNDVQIMIYFFGLYIGGAVYAGLLFTDYSRKETGVFNLLLPASHFEKALVNICYGVFLFWIVYTVCFMAVDAIGLTIFNRWGKEHLFLPFQIKSDDQINVRIFQLVFLFIQTLFVTGSIYFRRFSFFKTALCMVVIAMLLSSLLFPSAQEGNTDYSIIRMTSTSSNYNVDEGNFVVYTRHTAEFSLFGQLMVYAGGLLILGGLWTTIFWRLKEKQI